MRGSTCSTITQTVTPGTSWPRLQGRHTRQGGRYPEKKRAPEGASTAPDDGYPRGSWRKHRDGTLLVPVGGRTPPWWEESQPPGCPTAQQQQATPRERRHSATTAFTRAGCVPHRGWLEQMATGTWRRTQRKPGPDNEKQLNVVVGDTGIEPVTSSV